MIIKKIENIKEETSFLFKKHLNISNDECYDIISNISTEEEIEKIPNFLPRYVDKRLLSKLFENNFSEFLSDEFIKNIPQNILLSLDEGTLNKFTPQQICCVSDNDLYYLNKYNKLNYLNGEAVLAIINNRMNIKTGYYNDSLNTLLLKLVDNEKIKDISPSKISEIDINVFSKLDPKILEGFTREQLEGFGVDKVKNLLSNCVLHNFNDDVIKEFDKHLDFTYSGVLVNMLGFGKQNSFEKIKKQVQLFCQYDKIHLLSSKTLSTLDSYLMSEIKKDNLQKFSAEQLNAISSNFQYLEPEIVKVIELTKFIELNDTFLKNLTGEHAKYLNKEQIKSLINSNKLHLLKNDCVKVIIKNNFDKNFLDSIENDKLIKQINSFNNNFFEFIDAEQIHNIDKNIIQHINKEQFGSMSAEQLNSLNKLNEEFINYIPNIDYINDREFSKLDNDFLPKLTSDHVLSMNDNKINHLLQTDKMCFLQDNVIDVIKEKINFSKTSGNVAVAQLNNLNDRNKLDTLSVESLSTIPIKNIANELNENTVINISNLKPDIEIYHQDESFLSDEIYNKKDSQDIIVNLEEKDFDYAIKDYINREDYATLEDSCMEWCKNKDNKKNVINALRNNINNTKDNVYGIIDKIELLKLLSIVETGSKSCESYGVLKKWIERLFDTSTDSIDGDISRIKEISKLVREGYFYKDYNVELAKRNLENIDKCIKKYYSKSERNSLDSALKDLYANVLLDYANAISIKYSIDVKKFTGDITKINEINLTKEERIYFNTIKKAFEYKPDIESAVKSWATPMLKIVLESVGTVFGTKVIANATNSKVIGGAVAAVGTGIVVNDIVNQYDKKNYFLNPESYHKREREKEESFISKIVKNTKNVCYNGLIGWWFNPIKNLYNKRIDYDSKKSVGLQSNMFKKNFLINYENKCKLELDADYREKYDLMDKSLNDIKSREGKIIKDYIAVKAKSIDILMKKKLIELYKEYPEFYQEGFFSKLFKAKNIVEQIGKGLIHSVLDVATLGYGSDFYNKFIGNTEDTNKIKNEIRFAEFKEKLDAINKETCSKMNKLQEEKVRRLASLNDNDLDILNKITIKNKKEIEELEQYIKSFFIKDSLTNTLYDYYELNDIDDFNIKIDKEIIKKIDTETNILFSIEKMNHNKKNIENNFNIVYDQIISLVEGNANKDIIAKNINCALEEACDSINKGYMNFNDKKDSITLLFILSKNCENMNIYDNKMPKIVADYYSKKIEPIVSTKFKDLVKLRSPIERFVY